MGHVYRHSEHADPSVFPVSADHRAALGVINAVVTAKAPWPEIDAGDDLHLILDGEPVSAKQFHAECRLGAVVFLLGNRPIVGSKAAGP